MSVKVQLKYLRISPRKVRLVADLIRRKKAKEAEGILEFTQKKAAGPIQKLLRSGVAAAENDFKLNESNLCISKIFVDEGPTLKRWRPQARGRIHPIMKRTSHITIVLDEIKEKATKVAKVTKAAKETIEVAKTAEAAKEEKIVKQEIKRPKKEVEAPKPKIREKAQRVFRRKAF